MNQFKSLLVMGLFFGINTYAQDVSLHVDFTGSSFDAHSSSLQGTAQKVGDKIVASKLVLPIKTMSSGIAMRDKHLWKNFNADKNPDAVLTDVVGQGGKFTGKLQVNGKQAPVSGDYSVEGQKVNANFKTKMSSYGIEPPTYMGMNVEDEVSLKAAVPLAAAAAAPAAGKPAPANKPLTKPAAH